MPVNTSSSFTLLISFFYGDGAKIHELSSYLVLWEEDFFWPIVARVFPLLSYRTLKQLIKLKKKNNIFESQD